MRLPSMAGWLSPRRRPAGSRRTRKWCQPWAEPPVPRLELPRSLPRVGGFTPVGLYPVQPCAFIAPWSSRNRGVASTEAQCRCRSAASWRNVEGNPNSGWTACIPALIPLCRRDRSAAESQNAGPRKSIPFGVVGYRDSPRRGGWTTCRIPMLHPTRRSPPPSPSPDPHGQGHVARPNHFRT